MTDTIKQVVEYHRNGELYIIQYVSLNRDRQGEYIEFFKNGNLRYHYMFLNNKPHGECKKFNEKGELIYHRFIEYGINVTERVATYVDDLVMFKLVTDIPVLPEIDVAYLHEKYRIDYD